MMHSTKAEAVDFPSVAEIVNVNEGNAHENTPEKILLVLLVSVGTVCFLTNVLLLCVLLLAVCGHHDGQGGGRGQGLLCLRHRIVASQAAAGVVATGVALYPVKLLSHSLSTSMSSSSCDSWSSCPALLVLGSSAASLFALQSLAHAVVAHAEQAIFAIAPNAYMVLLASPGLVTILLITSLWLLPLTLSVALPNANDAWVIRAAVASSADPCSASAVWTQAYSVGVTAICAALVVAAATVHAIMNRRSACARADVRRRMASSSSSTLPILRPARKKVTAVVVLADALVSSSPFDQMRASCINVVVAVLVNIPLVATFCNFETEQVEQASVPSTVLWSERRWLSVSVVLALAGASLPPVLHLVSDHVISGWVVTVAKRLGVVASNVSDSASDSVRRRRPPTHSSAFENDAASLLREEDRSAGGNGSGQGPASASAPASEAAAPVAV